MRLTNHSVGQQRLIDLVPVVNVILLLMFFFLLSWSFVMQPGVEVRPPTVSTSLTTPQGRHVVTLKGSAREILIFFDEKNVDEKALKQELVIASKKNEGEWVTVNADDSVSHGRVQEVAAMVMESGFRVTLATQRNAISSPLPGNP